MKSFFYGEVATDCLAPKKYGNSETSKLRLFDTTRNTTTAQRWYVEAKKSFETILALIPTNENQRKLQPSLKAQIAPQLQAVAKSLSEAASWYEPAAEFLHQKIEPFARQYDISLDTTAKLSKEDCQRQDLTAKAVEVMVNAGTFGTYSLVSTLTK